MAKRRESVTKSQARPDVPAPDDVEVLLDVELADGMLWLVLVNASDRTAYNVAVVFREPLPGLGGERDIAGMGVFRMLPLLRPRREIRVLVDVAREFFARRQPTIVEARVSWQSRSGDDFSRSFKHDLAVWKDFGELVHPTSG
jgi:hypothetical protein